MAYTQADLDRLDQAIASGTLTLKLNGKEITYRSMSELMQARAFVASEIRNSSGGATGGAYWASFGRD